MTNDYSTEADLVGDSMDAVYENKQVNKKDDVSGDYSSDTASYPTVKAMKAEDAKKVNITDIEDSLTSTSANKVLSAKQGKILEDTKVPIRQATANRIVVTDNNKDIALHEKLGNISIDGKIGTDSGKIITTGTGGTLQASSDIGAAKVTDANSANYTHIGSLSSGASVQEIFAALNTKIQALEGIEIIKITTNKGTASASTMNKLYIEIGVTKTDLYYTKATTVDETTTYEWVKLEDNILEDISVDWSDIQNKPTILTQTDIDNSISDFATALSNRINPSSP